MGVGFSYLKCQLGSDENLICFPPYGRLREVGVLTRT